MKKILIIIFCTCLSLTFLSCEKTNLFMENEESTMEQTQSQGKSQSEDSVTKSRMDSIEGKVLVSKERLDSIEDVLNNKDNEIKTLKSKINNKMGLLDLFIYLAIYSLLMVVLVIFVVQNFGIKKYVSKQISDFLSGKEQNIPRTPESGMLHQHSQMSLKNSQDIVKIQCDIKKIWNEIQILKMPSTRPLPSVAGSPQKQYSQDTNGYLSKTTKGVPMSDVNTKANLAKEFFMPRPSCENTFDATTSKLVATEDTFFKFTRDDKNPNKAVFVFEAISSLKTKFAINSQNRIIDPVCEVDLQGMNGDCNTIEKGEAELKDGKWIVKRKAKVIIK